MRMRQVCRWLLIFGCFSILLAAGSVLAAESPAGDADSVWLQILTVNDFHGALTESGKNPGAAKLAAYLKQARAADPDHTLLVSAGDMFQGTIDSNLLYGKPVVDVMNEVGFDAMTLGNHEFDWGIDILKQRMAQSHFPYVCANVFDRGTGKAVSFVKPYLLLERSGVKIGIIGLATPETAYKVHPRVVSGYRFEDPARIVNALVPELKQQGADIILVLSHLPSWMDSSGVISGDAATLALQTAGVDGIVSGHSHQIVFGKVNGIPVVQAYCNGQAVGQIRLLYNKRSQRVEASTVDVTALPTPELQADPAVAIILDRSLRDIATAKAAVVGENARPLSHDRNVRAETLLGQWVTDIMRQAAGADIAFENMGALRVGLPAGTITMGNLYEITPFDNTLFTVEMTGRQVSKALEYGIKNRNIGMVQYAGLKVVYADAGPQAATVLSVTTLDGRPLAPGKVYKVAVNDFMAAGGDGFTMFQDGQHLRDTTLLIRDLLADAIRKQKTVDFSGDNRWHVTDLPQASS